MEAIVTANRDLAARRVLLRMKLFVAGNFVTTGEQQQFERLIHIPNTPPPSNTLGFVSDAKKEQALREADFAFVFPHNTLVKISR